VDFRDLILGEDDGTMLEQCLGRFIQDTGVRVAILMGRDGHMLSRQGDPREMDMESLCALSVGAYASSEALARLAGEENFNSIFHQGVRSNVYISQVGESHLLLTLFDYNASAPLVRLQAKVTAEAIVHILDRAYNKTRAIRAHA
jgi:predicted regulator of Ras-like GTPase activity (Roadblock/LC7/MglB family)